MVFRPGHYAYLSARREKGRGGEGEGRGGEGGREGREGREGGSEGAGQPKVKEKASTPGPTVTVSVPAARSSVVSSS